jgi:hypothetical protein
MSDMEACDRLISDIDTGGELAGMARTLSFVVADPNAGCGFREFVTSINIADDPLERFPVALASGDLPTTLRLKSELVSRRSMREP